MITQHTEQEAMTKWCPHTRLGRSIETYNRYEYTGQIYQVPDGTQCLASKCMMWVWTDFNEETNKRHYGKCGLTK